MQIFTVFVLSLFLTIALVPLFKKMAFRMNIVDVPDVRKVHVHPMPKTGGISMAAGMFIPFMLWIPKDNFISAVFLGAVILVISGLLDDIHPMRAWQKLLPQIAAAMLIILWGGIKIRYIGLVAHEDLFIPGILSVLLTLFVIIGVTNAINLSDGLDGLAGGISMLSFVMMAILAFQCGNLPLALISIAVVGAIAGFLRFNTHPAIVFMGDAGSQLLGFLAVVLALVLTQTTTPYSRVLSLTLIGFPILDTLTVMVERIAKKQSPFKADKNHFHHRLLRIGFTHAESVLIIYIIQTCFICLAFVFKYHAGWVHILIFGSASTAVLAFFYAAFKTGWRFNRDPKKNSLRQRVEHFLREKNIFIRICFGAARYGLLIVLTCQCMIPDRFPLWVALAAMGGILILCGLPIVMPRHQNYVFRFVACLMIPVILYFSELSPAPWFTSHLYDLNMAAFIFLVAFVLLTMRLTRRTKGFKLTTMDVLVFIVILIIPNLPTSHFETFGTGTALAKALILFFSFDVLIGEFRGDARFINGICISALLVMAVRGFFG